MKNVLVKDDGVHFVLVSKLPDNWQVITDEHVLVNGKRRHIVGKTYTPLGKKALLCGLGRGNLLRVDSECFGFSHFDFCKKLFPHFRGDTLIVLGDNTVWHFSPTDAANKQGIYPNYLDALEKIFNIADLDYVFMEYSYL